MAREFKRMQTSVYPKTLPDRIAWPGQIWLEFVVPVVNLVAPFLRFVKMVRQLFVLKGTRTPPLVYGCVPLWWITWLCAWVSLFGGNSYIADGMLNIFLAAAAALGYLSVLLVL